MEKQRAIAHVRRNEDGSWAEPQGLEEHLLGTARLAEGFAAPFDSGPWGYAEGIGHDTGKATETWQRYLCTKSGYDEEARVEEGRRRTIRRRYAVSFQDDVKCGVL